MKRIMFVCHGNICRSPMAEIVFRDMTERAGRGDEFIVASSATSAEEIWNGIGNPVYPPAAAELRRHGLSAGNKRAGQLQKSDYDKYDLFLVMDGMNERNALRIFGADPGGKVKKLMSYTPRGGDVADPWYTGDFSVTYRDVESACTALLESLTRG